MERAGMFSGAKWKLSNPGDNQEQLNQISDRAVRKEAKGPRDGDGSMA